MPGINPNGLILYQGPSAIDPSVEIVVIITGGAKKTKNGKTGNMLQTWILLVDVAPHVAAKDGRDVGICGDCKHRRRCLQCGAHVEACDCADPKWARPCYVLTHNAPRAVWSCFKRGGYRRADAADREKIGAGILRLGAYGDPAMVPIHVWEGVMPDRRTGYTHQWRRPEAQALRPYAMASVDSPGEAQEARAMGWRYFRVRRADDPILAGEVVCPASEEGGKRRTCETCKACAGNPNGRGASVVIIAHGATAKAFSRLPVLS